MRKWEKLTPFELSELEIALDHRLAERHAYVWRRDARRMLRGVRAEIQRRGRRCLVVIKSGANR